jgi:hypothetical protein
MTDTPENPDYERILSKDIEALGTLSDIEVPRMDTVNDAREFLSASNAFGILAGALERHSKLRRIDLRAGPTRGNVPYHFHAASPHEQVFSAEGERHSASGLTTYSYNLEIYDDPLMPEVASVFIRRGAGIHKGETSLRQLPDKKLLDGELLPLVVKDVAFDMAGAIIHLAGLQE